MGMSLTRWIAIMLTGLLLQACGFQMRGTAIPPELMTMKVVGDNKSDFYRLVTTRLKAAGVELAFVHVEDSRLIVDDRHQVVIARLVVGKDHLEIP